jgi:uncharacterized protein (DUF2249 family)
MAGPAETLSAHHLHLERLIEDASSAVRSALWHAYKARFLVLRSALLAHISYEEEMLYPELARGASTAAIEALQFEHATLKRHLDTLSAAAPEYDPEGCLAELGDLAALLREHHAAERALDRQYATRLVGGLSRGMPVPLDLRGLQPPEPIVRIFEALERAPSEPLRAILPHEPVPLYALLRERGFTYSGAQRADGGYELLIERS